MLTGEGRICWRKLLEEKSDLYFTEIVLIQNCLEDVLCINKEKSVYLCVPVGDQFDRHDVLQHHPGGEELLRDEDSAGWTQTLVVQSDRYWRNSLVWLGGVYLHTLFLHLHKKGKKTNCLTSSVKTFFKYKFIKKGTEKKILHSVNLLYTLNDISALRASSGNEEHVSLIKWKQVIDSVQEFLVLSQVCLWSDASAHKGFWSVTNYKSIKKNVKKRDPGCGSSGKLRHMKPCMRLTTRHHAELFHTFSGWWIFPHFLNQTTNQENKRQINR